MLVSDICSSQGHFELVLEFLIDSSPMLLTALQGGLHVWIQSNNTLLIKYYYNITPSCLVLMMVKVSLFDLVAYRPITRL